MKKYRYQKKFELEDISLDRIKVKGSLFCGFRDDDLAKLKKVSRENGITLGRRHLAKDDLFKAVKILNVDVSNKKNNITMSLSLNYVDILNTIDASDCGQGLHEN